MVLVSDDHTLDWSEIEPIREKYRKKVLNEFVRVWNKYKDIENDPFKWGDEIELLLVKFDHENKRVQLLLKSQEFFDYMNKNELGSLNAEFHIEYTNYIIEAIPGEPVNDDINSFLTIEENMKLRRTLIQNFLGPNEHVISLTCFPMLGCEQFSSPYYDPALNKNQFSSSFISDEIIQNFFKATTFNKRKRTGKKVSIYTPIFVDTNTPKPFVEHLNEEKDEIKENLIYMDHDAFGMGCCCIQVTFQADSLSQACSLYDQLTPIAPIILALSASSPIWRGYLSDVDCRWNILKQAMDERTEEELGIKPLNKNKFVIKKSRFDTTDVYLSEHGKHYNDFDFVKEVSAESYLLNKNVDKFIAQHYASILIRDPIMVLDSDLNNEDENFAGNFEIFNCTNWRLLRFKPPPIESSEKNKIGWRVEFRPTEIQFTDFENAAFATFIILLTKSIIKFKLNFLMNITKVDENVERAQKRDSIKIEKFYFRQNIEDFNDCCLVEMSLNTIINGSEHFKGILPIIRQYLDDTKPNNQTRSKIESYLKLIEQRANGCLLTPASWIRKFVLEHPRYEKDSKINHEINYDLIKKIHELSIGKFKCGLLIPGEDSNLI